MANGTTQATWNPWVWQQAAAATPAYGWGAWPAAQQSAAVPAANQAMMLGTAGGNQAAAAATPVAGTGASSWFPWGTDWSQTPWGGVEKDQAKQQMAWMNVALPWLQAAVQGQQWGQQFDWRKAMDEWQQQFQTEQFAHQKEADVWSQAFQEKQMEDQLKAQEEQTAMQTFGRRWKPQTRWM